MNRRLLPLFVCLLCLAAATASAAPFRAAPLHAGGLQPIGGEATTNIAYPTGSLESTSANSDNVDFITTLGGYTRAVTVQGNYAYIGQYASLAIIDVTTPTAPSPLGITPPFDDEILGVDIVGNYAYVAAASAGLRVVDISDPNAPIEVGYYDTADRAWDVTVVGNYAVVADDANGLCIINITDPAHPMLAGTFDTPGHAEDLAVAGNTVYVADMIGRLRVISIADPTQPVEVGSYDPGRYVEGVAVSGNRAVLALGDYGLEGLDISNPGSPVLAWTYREADGASDVAIGGDIAFVAERAGVRVLNIATPPVIVDVGKVDMDSAVVVDVAASGDIAYAASYLDGLRVISVAGPTPAEVGHYFPPVYTTDVAVAGTHAYVASQQGYLWVINVANPAAPVLAGHLDLDSGAWDVTTAGNYAYVAGDYVGLQVVNITDPTAPVLVGSLYTGESNGAVAVAGNLAYLASGTDGLQIINVSNPAMPVKVGAYDTPGWEEAVAVVGNYAYVGGQEGELRTINVSNPASPTLTSTIAYGSFIKGITAVGNYLYLANGSGGLRVISVANPASPVEAGRYDTPGYAMRVAVSGNYAYVADSMGGLQVLNVSSPSAPTLAGFYDGPANVWGVDVANQYVYTANGNDRGIDVLRFTPNIIAPAISGFSPTSGPVGTSVQISGTNLAGATAVTFNGASQPAFTVNGTGTQITASVPAGATTGKVSVTTPGGTANSAADFTVTAPAPTITSFSPASGPAGTSVQINGTNLTGATAVTFNGTNQPTFTINSATRITAAVPAGATTGRITVTTPGGTATSATNFTVVLAPTITSFTPASGPVGTSVTINGTAFTGATTVQFNGTNQPTFTINSATRITAAVPAGATTGRIAVTTPGGTATSPTDFTVTVVTSVPVYLSPTGAASVGGKAVTGADIVAYVKATNTWDVLYDGSYVRTTKNVGAFAFLGNDILLGFSAAQVVPGLGTTAAAPQDLVRFTPIRTGYNNTAGAFAWFFDGSDVGLTTAAEAIDALWIDAAGKLYISTTGTGIVPANSANPTGPKVNFQDEDVLRFTPAAGSSGQNTAGTWALYWDPTLITGMSAEDINGYWEDPATGDRYATILGAFTIGNAAYGGRFTGNGKTILRFAPNAAAPAGWAPAEKVTWLAPGATFPSNIDGIEIARP